MEKVIVSADALRQVLQALNGPGHRIMELQALRDGPFSGDNPINKLVDEYNAALQRPEDAEASQPAHDAPIRFFCHSEDAGYNEFDSLDKALECAESMLTDARGNAQFDGEWSEEETAIRYGAVIGEAVEVRTDEGGYEYFVSRPGSHPPAATCSDLTPGD